jgi:hypothetical protein
MLKIETKSDLQNLVEEGVEETLTLDYKASPALTRDGKGPDELCKDVSALANSTGGQIIYGIEEDKQKGKPKRVDDGVADPKITREWIEQILNSRVQPRMTGIRIARIDLQNGQFAYVISVPQSQIGPHQAPDLKYYRRYELQSVPMYDYEIKDVLRRSTTPNLRVVLYFDTGDQAQVQFSAGQEISKAIILKVAIRNLSPQPAFHVISDVALDADLPIPFPLSVYRQAAPRIGPPDFKVFRRIITSPPELPIFKEGDPITHTGDVVFQVPSSLLAREHLIHMETVVQTPGFSLTEEWKMHTHEEGHCAFVLLVILSIRANRIDDARMTSAQTHLPSYCFSYTPGIDLECSYAEGTKAPLHSGVLSQAVDRGRRSPVRVQLSVQGS